MKQLILLQFRQATRSFQKTKLFQFLYLFGLWCALMWSLSLAATPGIYAFLAAFAPALIALVSMGSFLPDLVFKLFTQGDATVMDAFIRTRPIPASVWERFLWLQQFWNPNNLLLPALALPFAVLFLPAGWGIMLVVSVYLVSVFDAIVVLEMKRGNPYGDISTSISRHRIKSSTIWGGYVYGLQSKSLLRSRRLMIGVLLLPCFFAFQALRPMPEDEVPMSTIFIFFACSMPALMVGQWGFGIEARSFDGLWSRPVSIVRLLQHKYYMMCLISSIAALVLAPLCLYFGVGIMHLMAGYLFSAGFANLMQLVDAYNRPAFDIFGKAFFNNQGTRGALVTGAMISMIFTILLPLGLMIGLMVLGYNTMWYDLILSLIGIFSFCFHRLFLRGVERRFNKKRYQYLEKYRE